MKQILLASVIISFAVSIFVSAVSDVVTTFENAEKYISEATEDVGVLAEETAGKCGDNLTWKLEDGTLTVSGNGDMYDYESFYFQKDPWYSLKDRIKIVVIDNGVKRIGEYAFENCKNLHTVYLPSSLEEVGKSAFSCSNDINKVYISDLVGWFKVSLEDLYSSPLYSGAKLYLNEELLITLNVPESITCINENTFNGCSSIENVIVTNNVKYIDKAFFTCNNLKTVSLSNSVSSMGMYEFFNCIRLESVVLGRGITDIPLNAFGYCSALKKIIIPKNVVSIHKRAFYNCNKLTIYGYKDSYAETFAYENNISFVPLIEGDINGDGVVNILDASTLLRHISGYETRAELALMDTNGDGIVNILDASAILRYLAGYEVKLN